jgi:V/A-type H+/Na+-transporting ATPase subunit D
MSTGRGGAPTRMNLLRSRRRLERVAKGITLLRRKREALVAELFRIARPAADLRVSIGNRAAHAYPSLLAALASDGSTGLRAIGWPWRELSIEMRPAQVWGIPIAEILARPPIQRSLAARGTPPGSTGAAPVTAATEFEQLVELLLDAANRETLLRRLGEAVSRTSRQVNTLERRVEPELGHRITLIRRALDEREREEHLRLSRLQRQRP